MAGVRVKLLLLLLSGTLLLVSVRGWEPINEAQLLSFYETGVLEEPLTFTSPDNSKENNIVDEEPIPEDELPEVEGDATSDNSDPFADFGSEVDSAESGPRLWTSSADGGFPVEFVDAPPRSWTSSTDGGFPVEFVDAPPRSWNSDPDDGFHMEFIDAPPRSGASGTSQSSTEPEVVCSAAGFKITLPAGQLSEVKVVGSKALLSVMNAPVSCDYKVDPLTNTLTAPFSACNVKRVHHCSADGYSLQFLYANEFGQTKVATAFCEEKRGKFVPRSSVPTSKCSPPIPEPPTPSKAQNCAVNKEEQVPCGQSGMSSSDCERMGCCVDSSTNTCYYPLDECTGDQHFVFAIRYNSVSSPIDPTKLAIPSDTNCKPAIVNDKVAIFKFKVTECGTRAYEVGETKIYLAEVQSVVQALNLKYGVITRSDPLRFMVECRYSKSGAAQQSLASVGYMVKIPSSTLPSEVISFGRYGVEMKIAKDNSYSSYYPTYHQPLRLLLGNPVYLELNLKSPKPDAVILVNYCIAYPRSAKNALVLVYEGCRNPLDTSVSVLQLSDLPQNRYQRRFVVKAFQFMDQTTNKYLDEEIYFMCSTEVCRPSEKTCVERCFDGKTP